ncbi:MAG: DsbA family protein, partial [Zavarzinia sp.]|nr:DsbA family protein [Zavarzinia sp.]
MSDAIEFWFDFSSAYAFFAAREIDNLGARVGRPVRWRPYMLGTAFKVTGARGLSSTPLKKDYARLDWARLA